MRRYVLDPKFLRKNCTPITPASNLIRSFPFSEILKFESKIILRESSYRIGTSWGATETRRGKRLDRQAAEHNLTADQVLALGKKAKERLTELVAGQEVNIIWLHGHIERGPYCRLTGYVEIGGNDVVVILLDNGLVWLADGVEYQHPRSGKYSQCYRGL